MEIVEFEGVECVIISAPEMLGMFNECLGSRVVDPLSLSSDAKRHIQDCRTQDGAVLFRHEGAWWEIGVVRARNGNVAGDVYVSYPARPDQNDDLNRLHPNA
jgi:hypothetical protein